METLLSNFKCFILYIYLVGIRSGNSTLVAKDGCASTKGIGSPRTNKASTMWQLTSKFSEYISALDDLIPVVMEKRCLDERVGYLQIYLFLIRFIYFQTENSNNIILNPAGVNCLPETELNLFCFK